MGSLGLDSHFSGPGHQDLKQGYGQVKYHTLETCRLTLAYLDIFGMFVMKLGEAHRLKVASCFSCRHRFKHQHVSCMFLRDASHGRLPALGSTGFKGAFCDGEGIRPVAPSSASAPSHRLGHKQGKRSR